MNIPSVDNLPNEFLDAVEDLKISLERIPTKVKRVIAVAEKYGIDPKLVKSLIRRALENVLSERTIERYLSDIKTRPRIEKTSNKVLSANTANLAELEDNIIMVESTTSSKMKDFDTVNCTRCNKVLAYKNETETINCSIFCEACILVLNEVNQSIS